MDNQTSPAKSQNSAGQTNVGASSDSSAISLNFLRKYRERVLAAKTVPEQPNSAVA